MLYRELLRFIAFRHFRCSTVTDRGKISVITYDLLTDKNGDMYFEYGCMLEKVNIDDFEGAE